MVVDFSYNLASVTTHCFLAKVALKINPSPPLDALPVAEAVREGLDFRFKTMRAYLSVSGAI